MKFSSFKLLLFIIILLLTSDIVFSQYSWTKDVGNPIFSGGGNGAWDKHVGRAVVLFNTDSSRFEMWYSGSYGPEISWRPNRIGFAWSSDGINWIKYSGNPVLIPEPGTFDEGSVEGHNVIRENGQYKMWYSGLRNGKYQIGYATSSDGMFWNKYLSPVLTYGNTGWDAGGVGYGNVLSNPGGYTMYYSGIGQVYAIGRATSLDGITWQKDTINNPILTPGLQGQWDDVLVGAPNCFQKNNILYMYYEGWQSTGIQSIGLATSTNDGVTWSKYGSNPVLIPGISGSWDASYVEAPIVIFLDDTIHMWYGGAREPTENYLWRIGHAISPFDPVSVESETTLLTEFVLKQNYPNPFNPITKIRYSIPNASKVTIIIYNVLGKEIETLVNKEKPVGTYELNWNAANLPSGVYFYQLKAHSYVETKKMILLR